MKLCFLASANSIHSLKWAKFFAKKNHKVFLISLTPSPEKNIENVNLYISPYLIESWQFKISFLWKLLLNIFWVRRLIKKIKPDILHSHYAGVNGLLGALSDFHPYVLTAWGSDVLIVAKSKIKGPLVRFALDKADLITCDAEHMKDAMIKLGVSISRIKIIYFGVDVQKFCPGPRDKKLKNELGISGHKIVFSLRNLEPIYDVETLIKTAPLILKEIPETKFIIASRGSEEEKLKELAKNLNILGNIRFTGWIPNDELPEYLRIADVLVSTSLSDAGIAGSTAEAMACGLPVVITNTGENEKWVKDGENGYLIPVKNPEVLAKKLIYLLKNERVRKKFGKANRKIIEERNNYYKEMEKMEKIYNDLT